MGVPDRRPLVDHGVRCEGVWPWPTSPTGISSPTPAPTGVASPRPGCSITSGAWRSRSRSTSLWPFLFLAVWTWAGPRADHARSVHHRRGRFARRHGGAVRGVAIRRGCIGTDTRATSMLVGAAAATWRCRGSSPPSWYGRPGHQGAAGRWAPWCAVPGSPPTAPARGPSTAAGCSFAPRPPRGHHPRRRGTGHGGGCAAFRAGPSSSLGRSPTGSTCGTGHSTCSVRPSRPTSTHTSPLTRRPGHRLDGLTLVSYHVVENPIRYRAAWVRGRRGLLGPRCGSAGNRMALSEGLPSSGRADSPPSTAAQSRRGNEHRLRPDPERDSLRPPSGRSRRPTAGPA